MRGSLSLVLSACALTLGCAPAATVPDDAASAPPSTESVGRTGSTGEGLVPPGYGTLHQDDFTISLRRGPLLLKVTPLDESVIRLAAPDTYNRLHGIAASRRAEAAASTSAGEPELFLVSFFSYQPDVEFQPEDVQLAQQGRISPAAAILPVTSGWGRQRLQQQETQTAIYAFEQQVDWDLPLGIRYGAEESMEWAQILQRLRVERAKVEARAGRG